MSLFWNKQKKKEVEETKQPCIQVQDAGWKNAEEPFIAPNVRILAVDDNDMNLQLVCGILKSTKMQVDTAYNGVEALERLEKEPAGTYHMILLDHMMPELDGVETIREIKKRGLCPGVPIAVVTANAVEGAEERYQEEGFNAYLPKPFGSKQLKTMIRTLLPPGLIGELEKKNAAGQQNEQAHIVIVDDDMVNLRIAEKILANRFAISCVKSGAELFEFLEHEIPNLILLDIHMPKMNGFEVMEKLRQSEHYREIPIVFLTADDDRESEIRGFKEGALDFITKPFVAEIMIQRVGRILELDRLQKNLQAEVEKQTARAEERRRKVERLSLQIMETLASTIDAKDKYTNGHSYRVAEYSREIAKRTGMSEKEQEDIYYMGLLHDIGKLGIPDAIIRKSQGLTNEEYELIKSHPVIGGDILKNMSEIPGIEMGARWHHEKYDGTGYPDGLKGNEIPLVARIIGVADAYDAMASKRSYRDVLPQDVVRAEVEKGSGTQFDPVYAKIMLDMIDEDTDYKMCEH
jgi:putative two-component system response regulator